MTPTARKCNICTVKTYGEYCPIALAAETVGDRWTPLVLRELICGSHRFSDIHRGVPRMSRTLLAQRLKQLERVGIIERRPGPTYHLTPAGEDLEKVVFGLGDWAMKWMFGDPAKEHHDGAHLIWRVRQRVVLDALPAKRTVVEFNFPAAHKGKRIWLLLDPGGPWVCERDEGFEVDVVVKADIGEFMRIWAGRSTWADGLASGKLAITGPRNLVRAFPTWFALSPYAAMA